MTRTINLSNTQFRYQLVFFAHTVGYIWLAEGCLWHLLPRQNLQWHLLPRQNLPAVYFAQAKHARRYILSGCMICLMQRNKIPQLTEKNCITEKCTLPGDKQTMVYECE